MSNGYCLDSLLILPSEVLKHIFSYLSCANLESIRPTCNAFNAVIADLLCERLQSMRLQADKAAVKFLQASWLKTNHAGIVAVLTYAKRLTKGSGSLVVLAGMIRTADLCSRQLVQVGALPPLSGFVLEEMSNALKMATWRNPLVGVIRLQYLHRSILYHFRHNRVLDAKELPPAVMFRTVLDVLQNMPSLATSRKLERTEQGVCVSCSLPSICVNLRISDSVASSSIDDLLLKLVQLSMHVVDRNIVTWLAQQVIGDDPFSEHEGYITDIRVTVPCGEKEGLSFQQLRKLEPTIFFVTLSGFKNTTPLDLEDLEAREDLQLEYSFRESVCYE